MDGRSFANICQIFLCIIWITSTFLGYWIGYLEFFVHLSIPPASLHIHSPCVIYDIIFHQDSRVFCEQGNFYQVDENNKGVKSNLGESLLSPPILPNTLYSDSPCLWKRDQDDNLGDFIFLSACLVVVLVVIFKMTFHILVYIFGAGGGDFQNDFHILVWAEMVVKWTLKWFSLFSSPCEVDRSWWDVNVHQPGNNPRL